MGRQASLMLPSARTERLQCKVAVKGMEVCVGRHTAVFRCDVVSVLCHTSREGAVQQRQPRLLSNVQRGCKT